MTARQNTTNQNYEQEDERNFLNDAQRKQRYLPTTKKVGEALSKLMARKGYGRVLASGALAAAWQEAAGERLAGHTRAGNVSRGVLEVFVKSSAVLQELTFAKSQILKRLIVNSTESKIRNLKFKLGAID